MPPLGSSHERLYRALLRAYPAEFRTRFGDEMVQLFGDQMRDARTGRAYSGPVGTWFRTLGDLAVTAASEHTRRDRTVAHSLAQQPSTTARTLGILGVLGGLILLAGYLPNLPWGHDLFILRLVLFNLGAIAIGIAVHLRQASISPRLSLAVAVPTILANAWYGVMVVLSIGRPVYPEPDADFRPIFFYVANAMWLTDAIFGLVAYRLGAVSRAAALLLAVGSIIAWSAMGNLADTFPWLAGFVALLAPIALWGVALAGLGWVLLGIDVARRRRGPASAGAPAEVPPGR
jgi:hypothetical protein